MTFNTFDTLQGSVRINLEKLSKVVNSGIPLTAFFFGILGYSFSFYFHFITVTFIYLTVLNFIYLHVQKRHALLSNYGIVAQMRYMIESIGPELRQYLFSSDTEEKPFSRVERNEVYRKSKGIDSSSAFGSQLLFNENEIKLRHSMFPQSKESLEAFSLCIGEERGLENSYTLKHPLIISAMSYGALGKNAIRALARGAKKAGILMNTGEGGFPKYHLMEDCDLVFQIGTAKFGVRNEDGTLSETKLAEIASFSQVKVIEIKFSQGAKPGKGGLLPKEKITKEISELRGVPMGEDIVSPSYHPECTTPQATVQFIKKVQDISKLPVGIKLCLGLEHEFLTLIQTMKALDIFPDYISIDGAEGGTGAAPKTFMDDLGLPIYKALPKVQNMLIKEGVRDRLKLMCAGKMINSGRQFMALSMGADAIYSARGFLLAIGCIQALQCNKNTCPTGITTHDNHLQAGLDIEDKANRVQNYIQSLDREYIELIAALGKKSLHELNDENLFLEGVY
ncbi:MAG: FMN-binding glutamate synthase family protein [Planctomycetota bacterium]|nr:MAG: FMN-binding glutamate synthase family protein [Planctomycetota bacterium]